MVVVVHRIVASKSLAVAVCAVGRAVDFATTWVAVGSQHAAEAKPFPADMIHLLGARPGLIAYEFLITMPVIFLGCRLANQIQARRQPQHDLVPMSSPLLYSIGTISVLAAIHNLQYLF
jgi:hypothetical protein